MSKVYIDGLLAEINKPLLATALERLTLKSLEDELRIYTSTGHSGWARASIGPVYSHGGDQFNYRSNIGRDRRPKHLKVENPSKESLKIKPNGERYMVVIESDRKKDTVTVYKEITHTIKERKEGEGTKVLHHVGEESEKRLFKGINPDSLDKTVLAHVFSLLP
tara:strand:+ start:334 stop:825 length:492 start_codon:yes stop_codon:yes gene_type:complete